MDISINKAAANVFIPDPSPEDVLEHLRELYKSEITHVIEEIDELLPSYRTVVASETYARDQAKVRLVGAYVSEGTMSVHALAIALNYLLKQQKRLSDALHQNVSSYADQGSFQLQCQDTGIVKAYMKMTRHKAEACNSQLAGEGSCSRWVFTSAVRLEGR